MSRGFKCNQVDLKVKCPNCRSRKMVKAGFGAAKGFKVKQRYTCKNCGIYTIEPIKV